MQQGFFSKKETQSETRPDGKTYSCASCGCIKEASTPRMKPYGNFRKGILNIGSIPTDIEDKKGKPWQGLVGRYLAEVYLSLGIDLFEDCLNIHAMSCHSTKSIGNYEIACCRKTVLKAIKDYQPKLIILFGQEAVESVIGHRWKNDFGKIDKWRGWTIPDQGVLTWVCPVFHPDKIANGSKETQTVFKIDLENAVKTLEIPFPKYKKPVIEIIEDLILLTTIKKGTVAIDYETTGIKPHSPGHRIICASVADSKDHCYVFMMPKTPKERKPFLDLLRNPNVKKVAQNMKFEEVWSLIRLKQSVVNWFWDTMLATHILDNRPGVTGLKFQTYVQLGIVDYASEIAPFLKAKDDKNGNAINEIELLVFTKEGRTKLMTYCAYDTIYEYRLAAWQLKVLKHPFANKM